MVKGLELFRDHFAEHSDCYILIGGTACDLAMTDFGVEFRATKDLDIVLSIEMIDASFGKSFWDFVQAGGYEICETDADKRNFYRFQKPTNPDYPAMLELFSRVPDTLKIAEGTTLTPIPMDDDVSSLSAILLDDAYYDWIHDGKIEIEGVPTIGPVHLIPLKAKAWLDLSDRKAAGNRVDSRDIKKHVNDVFRLFGIIEPESKTPLVDSMQADMMLFLDRVKEIKIDLKAFGLEKSSLESVLNSLREIYEIE